MSAVQPIEPPKFGAGIKWKPFLSIGLVGLAGLVAAVLIPQGGTASELGKAIAALLIIWFLGTLRKKPRSAPPDDCGSATGRAS